MTGHARTTAGVLCLLVGVAGATFPAIRADDSQVRVYTNADLDRYPVAPESDVRAAQPSEEDWRFVTEYLARQYSRLDAERRYSMDRQRAEAETEWIRTRADRRSYGLPLFWNRFDRGFVGPVDRGKKHGSKRIRRALIPDGSLRPLHAGPTRAEVDYHKATRRSGADAFPSNSRRQPAAGNRRR